MKEIDIPSQAAGNNRKLSGNVIKEFPQFESLGYVGVGEIADFQDPSSVGRRLDFVISADSARNGTIWGICIGNGAGLNCAIGGIGRTG